MGEPGQDAGRGGRLMCRRTSDHRHWCITCKRYIAVEDVKVHQKIEHEVETYEAEKEDEKTDSR